MSRPNTIRQMLAAKIHEAFTAVADQLAARGYVSQEQRIALSGAIGAMLDQFNKDMDETVGETQIDAYDVDWLANKEAGSNLSVFKAADGRYRWILFSSSSFEDRDGEIVSQLAQEKDCALMNATKQFGTLDWWHTPLVLGDCDFADMHGRIRVELGTYRDEEIGAAMAAHQDDLAASLAFYHPVTEPQDGVFKTIRTFSRAILPRGTESNKFTRLFVAKEETAMLKEKIDALTALLGGGKDAENKVQAILAAAQQTEQKALEDGVAFKAADDKPADEKPADETESVANEPIAEDKPVAPEAKADGEMAAGETEVETTPDQLIAALQAVIAPLATRIEELAAALGQQSASMTAMESGAMKAADEQKTALATASKQITALETRLKALEGETPRGMAKPGFVASRDAGTITKQEKASPSQMEAALGTINQYILGGQPNN